MESSQLPRGWTWVNLEEVISEINPGFPSGKHNKAQIGVPHLRPMNISAKGEIDLNEIKYVEVTDYDNLKAGDVIFNNTNSPKLLGKTTWIRRDTNWAYSNHMTRIRLNPNLITPPWAAGYLHYLFLTGYFMMNCTHHVNQASINVNFLVSNVKIPLPPLAEQQRIVAKIEELFTQLDAGVEALQRARVLLKRYRQAVLNAAVTGELTREWREAHQHELEPASALLERIQAERRAKWEDEQRAKGRNPESIKYPDHKPVDTRKLPKLSDGWTWVRIDELACHVTSGSRGWAKYYSDSGSLFIRVGNFNRISKALDLSNLVYVNAPGGPEADRTRLKLNDLLITITADVGMVGVVDSLITNQGEAYINQHVCLIRFIVPDLACFIAYSIASEEMQKQIKTKQYGATKIGLNLDDIKSITLALPPLTEQAQIVDKIERKFSFVQELEQTISKNMRLSAHLRQSILKYAFEGKLINQDPNDEPASVLLERIKAGKEKHLTQLVLNDL